MTAIQIIYLLFTVFNCIKFYFAVYNKMAEINMKFGSYSVKNQNTFNRDAQGLQTFQNLINFHNSLVEIKDNTVTRQLPIAHINQSSPGTHAYTNKRRKHTTSTELQSSLSTTLPHHTTKPSAKMQIVSYSSLLL